MKYPSKATLSLLAAVAIPVAAARADTITFNLNGSEGDVSYSLTVDGLTLNLFNATEQSPRDVFAFGGDGALELSNPSYAFVSAFDFSFSSDVSVLSYNVSSISSSTSGSDTFDLSGPGGASSTGNDLTSVGSSSINGTFDLAGGNTGTWTVNAADTSVGFDISSITVTSPIPEPSTYAWWLGGLAGLFALLRRRKTSAA